MTHYLKFVNTSYKPNKDDLICLFRIEPAKGISMKEAIGRVAAESSNGTWTTLTTLTPRIEKLGAKAYEIKGNHVKVAYPLDLFEKGSIPQLMSSIGGNIFGMKAVNNLRLEDIHFPKKYIKSFKGPELGIKGIRKLTKVKKRPLTATVPKPKVGMNVREFSNASEQIWRGGVDFVKTDENMTSQPFINFYKNTEEVLKRRDKVEKETSEKKLFLANVTAETREMIKRAKFVHDKGGEFVMIDVLTSGYSGFQTLRDFCHDYKLGIHIHRASHAMFTRNPKHGMTMKALAKMVRLIGGDTIHIGTAIGKLVGTKNEILDIQKSITEKQLNLKQTMPCSSGGLHPGIVPQIIEMLGKDILIQAGGGVLGNPLGPEAGAKALRQSIDASLEKTDLKIAAKRHPELSAALHKWGHSKPV